MLSAAVEIGLWATILTVGNLGAVAGFERGAYLTYILWATFVARLTANWYYEMEMDEEIESGRINTILLRPISFYEYYLSQFLGYKLSTLAFSFAIPALVSLYFPTTVIWSRLLPMLALLFYYLVFTYTLSFCVACLAFRMTRVRAITAMKNMSLWLFTGELFPLDLVPEPFRHWMIASPVASGVYVPVGFLTGRLGWHEFQMGFVSITLGLVFLGCVAMMLWKSGVRSYIGTGA